MFTTLDQYLSGDNYDKLMECFGEVNLPDISSSLNQDVSKKISARFLYIQSLDRYKQPNVEHLAKCLSPRIYKVCVPPNTIKDLEKEHLPDQAAFFSALQIETAAVLKTARASKNKANNTGELGELLVSILLEAIHRAPIIAHKLHTKYNKEANVHGNDGIHAYYDTVSNKLTLLFCESKMIEARSTALSDAISSMETYEDRKKRDLTAIAKVIDINVADEATKTQLEQRIKEYMNTWESPTAIAQTQELNVCMLSYNAQLYKDLDKESDPEKALAERYQKHIKDFFETIKDDISKSKIKNLYFHFMILPFEDMHDFMKNCNMDGFQFFEEAQSKKASEGNET